MARRHLLFGLLIVGLGALLLFRPFLTRDREVVVSTPGPVAIEPSHVDVPAGSEVCLESVPLGPDSELAQLGVVDAPNGGPALELRAEAPGGYRATARVPGGWKTGPVVARLRPPARETIGTFCARNAGTEPTQLAARGLGRVTARPLVRLDGGEIPVDVVLSFVRSRQESLGGRLDEVFEHATALTPLPAWLLWLLAALAAFGIPALALLALRAAGAAIAVESAAGPAAPAEPAAAPAAPQSPLAAHAGRLRAAGGRTAARLRDVPAPVWVGLIVLVAAVWFWIWASRVGTFQNDEDEYVYLARWVGNNLPESLWNFDLMSRGLQRLEVWILAVPLALVKAPEAFQLARAVNVAVFVSAAFPAYLLTRGLGARPRWAVLAAFVAIVGPWAVYTTSFLTEPVAFGIWVWVLWATWRAALVPGWRTDALALVLVGLAALTRSGFVILAPLVPAVVIAQRARFGHLREVLRFNPLVSAAVAAGVLVLAADVAGALPLEKLGGSYGSALNIIFDPFIEKTSVYGARLAIGIGFIPFAIGLPWLVARVIRPGDQAAFAFATTALIAALLLFILNSPAGADERYIIYLGPPLAVAACAALARRDVRPAAVLAAAAFGAWLVWRQGWNPEGGGFGFFIGPTESFYARVGLLRLEGYLPGWLPVRTAALLLMLGVGALSAWALTRRPRAAAVAALLVGALVVVQLAQAEYTLRRYVNEGGQRFGPPLSDRAWVDRAIYGKGRAAIFPMEVANNLGFEPIWREIQFWNTSVSDVALTRPRGIRTPPGDSVYDVAVDPATGRIEGPPLPPYAVVPRGWVDLRLAGETAANSSYLQADLIRLARPPRARLEASGPQGDGFLLEGNRARVRVWRGDLDPGRTWCLRVPLNLPPDVAERNRGAEWEIRLDGARASDSLANGKQQDVDVKLPDREVVDAVISARGRTELPDGREVSIQIGQLGVLECD